MKALGVGLGVLSLVAEIAGVGVAQTYATGDTRLVAEPKYPAVCETLAARFTTAQRTGPPVEDDTQRLQAALNRCAGTGKSVVLAAAGAADAFYSGRITLHGAGLVVGRGVTLEANDSYSAAHELVLIDGENSFLGGLGVIDGRGDLLDPSKGLPRLVQTAGADGFVAYQITLRQAIHPVLYIKGGTGATVWGITIDTPPNRHNADGIDLDSVTNATVYGSSIEAGDDGVAVKTNATPAANITVRGNRVYGTHGLSIGSQTYRGVTNVLFTDNYVYGYGREGIPSTWGNAINIKTDAACGGLVKQVTYRNTCITGAKRLIIVNAVYGKCSGTPGTPQFEDIVIDGVKTVASPTGSVEIIAGLDKADLAQVYLGNIDVDATTQHGDQNATVWLDRSNVVPAGPYVTTQKWKAEGSVPVCQF